MKNLLLIIFVLLFAGCSTIEGLPTTFGVGDPADEAISCIEDRMRCVERCEIWKDGKLIAFTETPLKPELCELQQPVLKPEGAEAITTLNGDVIIPNDK